MAPSPTAAESTSQRSRGRVGRGPEAARSVEGGPIDELLDVVIERPVLDQLQVGFVAGLAWPPRVARRAADPVVVTRAPSFVRAQKRSLLGLGGGRGDGFGWLPFEGLHDTAALGSRGAVDWLKGDAPSSAG